MVSQKPVLLSRCTKRHIVQPSIREGRYSMPEKGKIEKGVVSMLKLNMGVKSGERLLIATDVSTSLGQSYALGIQ